MITSICLGINKLIITIISVVIFVIFIVCGGEFGGGD